MLSDSDIEEIIDKILEPVQELVDSLEDEKEYIPTTNVVHFSRSPTGHRIQWLNQPSKIVTNPNFGHPPNVNTHVLEDAAEWIVQNHILPGYDTDELHYQDKVDIHRAYLASIAGKMMDYKGGIEYDEELLKKTVRNTWNPGSVEILIPLINFRGHFHGFKLPIDDNSNIDSLEISLLSDEERSAIYTYEYSETIEDTEKFDSTDPSQPSQGQWGIKIPAQSDEDVDAIKVADRVLTALRLFQPYYDVDTGPVYTLYDGWMAHRFGVPMVTEYQDNFKERDFTTDKYSMVPGRAVFLFRKFWNDFQAYIKLSDASFSGVLTRLNMSYQKESPEDQLVDCVIEFEESLLQGITQTESYRFRLPLRGSLLTNQFIRDREDRFWFFRDVYDARSMVVHENKDLERFSTDYGSVDEFIQTVRAALCEVVVEYMKNLNYGVNVDQTNQNLDSAAKNAEYTPAYTEGIDRMQMTLDDFA